MTLLEAIFARHSVRRYRPDPIPEETLSTLRKEIERINRLENLHVQLVIDEPKAFSSLMSYGSFSGVRNYFVMAGPNDDSLDEKIGYWGEWLVLFSQSLGLNTCWAGLSYRKVPGTYELSGTEKIACYIALGLGRNQGVQHRSKTPSQVSNQSTQTPSWFNKGVEAALAAPTAVNQQKFRLEYLGQDDEKIGIVAASASFSVFGYTKIDLGIVKLHFEIAAGRENFRWV